MGFADILWSFTSVSVFDELWHFWSLRTLLKSHKIYWNLTRFVYFQVLLWLYGSLSCEILWWSLTTFWMFYKIFCSLTKFNDTFQGLLECHFDILWNCMRFVEGTRLAAFSQDFLKTNTVPKTFVEIIKFPSSQKKMSGSLIIFAKYLTF